MKIVIEVPDWIPEVRFEKGDGTEYVYFVMSTIYQEQLNELVEVMEKQGFSLEMIYAEDGFLFVEFSRPERE